MLIGNTALSATTSSVDKFKFCSRSVLMLLGCTQYDHENERAYQVSYVEIDISQQHSIHEYSFLILAVLSCSALICLVLSCYFMPSHVLSYPVLPFPAPICHVVCHVVLYHALSCPTPSRPDLSCSVIIFHVYHVMPCSFLSCLALTCLVLSYNFIKCHVMPCQVM